MSKFQVGDRVKFTDTEWREMTGLTGTVTELMSPFDGKQRVRIDFDDKSGDPLTIWFDYRIRKLTKLDKVLK